MNLYAKLENAQWRDQPLVWIRRIVIRENDRRKKPIQDVKLKAGLNFIWGVESPKTEDKELESGHNLGKTTFCHLMRFCLGEKTFGKPALVDCVAAEFPEGFVEAEVEVDCQVWCVRRYFASGHMSFARQTGSLTSFRRKEPDHDADDYRVFMNRLERVTTSGFDSQPFLTGDIPIGWRHLLAISSRDQEGRNIDLLEWRSTDSGAESLRFKRPKADAVRCLLAMLGAYTEKERLIDERETAVTTRIKRLVKERDEHKQKLAYWVEYYRQQLDATGVSEALDRPIGDENLYDLRKAVQLAQGAAREEINWLEKEIETTERHLGALRAQLAQAMEFREENEGTHETISDPIERQKIELRENRSRLLQLRETIARRKFDRCGLGNVSYGMCDYVRAHDEKVKGELNVLPEELPEDIKKREAVAVQLKEVSGRLREFEDVVGSRINVLTKEKQNLDRRLRKTERRKDKLDESWKKLQEIDLVLKGKATDDTITPIEKALDAEDANLKEIKQVRAESTKGQSKDLAAVRFIFDLLVKQCVADEYRGVVSLAGDDLLFQIWKGDSDSGVAHHMLAILLADISIAVLGAGGLAQHPGILIHDSPREAGLGSVAYTHFLENISIALESLAGKAGCPVQYIVTTSTPPPQELNKKPSTCLKLGGRHGTLFGRSLNTARQQQTEMFAPNDTRSAIREA